MSYEVDGEPVAVGGPEDRLLPWERVRDIAGISRTTAWRMQRTGDFPTPVTVSPGRVGWWESELTAWKGTRVAGRKSNLRSPARPRLPGMARANPARAASSPSAVEAEPPPASKAREIEAPPVTPRRSRPRLADPGQIDFGF